MPIPVSNVSSATINLGVGLFYVHTVSVETLSGSGPYGDVYLPATTIPCFVDDSARLVRNKSGDEVTSSTTIYADPEYALVFAPDSRVTVNGRTAYIITTNSLNGGPLGLPDHVEVHLT